MKKLSLRKIKRFIILILSICFCGNAHADIIQSCVLDAETHEPLYSAHVEVTETVPDVVTATTIIYTDSLGCFKYSCWGGANITIRTRFLGYKTNIIRMKGTDAGDTIRINDILLQPSEALLQEMLVKGAQRRFYMHGDTVVFNPGALQMEDGDRLMDLILKLPDVTIEEDRLLWNGKPLQIRMNGKEAMSEDLLLKRLLTVYTHNQDAAERQIRQQKIWIVAVSVFVIVLGIFIVVWLRIRHKRRISSIISDAESSETHLREELDSVQNTLQDTQRELSVKEKEAKHLQRYIIDRTDITMKLKKGTTYVRMSSKEWADVEQLLDEIDDGCISKIRARFSHLSIDDIRLCVMVRIGMSNPAIGNVYGITPSAVQHRKLALKKKGFGVENPDVTLDCFLASL